MDLGRDKVVTKIISRLAQADNGAVKVEGTWGSFARLLAAYISEKLSRPILYICPHIDDADRTADDMQTFGCSSVDVLAAWEGEEELADATDETRAERLKLVFRVSQPVSRDLRAVSGVDNNRLVITAPVQAICQPVPKPESLAKSSLQLELDKTISPEVVVEWLVENSFERVDQIDLPGQFARRGGIIDIYAPLINNKVNLSTDSTTNTKGNDSTSQNGAEAIRVEFFGDSIESLRIIDLDTQRSTEQLGNLSIVSAICGTRTEQKELFINTLPKNTIVILEEPSDIEEVAAVFCERVQGNSQLYGWSEIYNAMAGFAQLHICRFATSGPGDFLKVDIRSIQQFERKATSLWSGHKAALEELLQQAKAGKKVLFYCESQAEIKRVNEIIKEISPQVPPNFKLELGFIHQGFVINSLKTIVVSHHELFGQFALRRRQRPVRTTAPVDTLSDLQEGDYVVHASYGIGKFLGINTIQKEGCTSEYLKIGYADGVKIQVSVRNIALVQKYIGTSPKRPKLSKVGSKRWQKQKEKVTKSVRDLALELLQVQAKRQAMCGIAFGDDSNWQVEFEESFAYQETPDQTTAAEQIKADMQEPVAMDRLLCGDVGYGKTELAMRAAFKTVESGKQIAMLVPTTVLSVQHERTFTERFADFPICIEVLNRFKTTKQASDIIARTKQGKVDILIGTHRLLSGDIKFKDLGLLIIDEEQRFGVEHKEKLKKLRVNVDILTMTATPIPRTLHMSMLGLRDISSLATPPLDRRSIVTRVTAYNRELIRKAIFRELNRQGQVFFLHNRVKTIEKKAWEIQKLVPDAKVRIAHGQMAKSELEKAMIDFVLGQTDVLVCTTIIESGLDIPNANTILINDADRFGLAELHQLRGRVGRYKHRAYAYMLLPATRPITPTAAKRLKAIEEYSHLGAGFRIALRDLEIRGAGNILGPEQSGHIQTVGYQMYCELLANAVKQLNNEPIELIPTAAIDLGFTAYISKNYIPIDRHRMDVYRRIAVARNVEDLKQIESELADIYGPVPDEVKLLLEVAELRIAASRHGIKSITVSGQDLVFLFANEPGAKADSLFANTTGKVRITDSETAYLHLSSEYFEPRTLIAILRKMLKRRTPMRKRKVAESI
jgi:transcription-repair coupling factor (superfamily II helicase)